MNFRLLFVFLLAFALGALTYTLINLHYIDVDIDKVVDKRLNVYTQTISCGRNSQEIYEYFPQSSFVINDNATCPYPNTIDTYAFNSSMDNELNYKYKYVDTLRHCLQSDKMLCMILEDDITFLHRNASTWRNIAINTVSLFANEECFYDCSSRGLWLKTGITGNKSLCRIFTKERLPDFIPCLMQKDDPIDIGIARCQEAIGICQKRFLLVQHTGMSSTLGHKWFVYNIPILITLRSIDYQ